MINPDLFVQLSKQFASGASNEIFVLVDAAQFQEIWPALTRKYQDIQWLSLLENTRNQDAIKAGPLLLLIQKHQLHVMEWLLEHSESGYFLSWINSLLPFVELRDHLNGLLDVEIEGSGNWFMRYFDTRILPVWCRVLTDEQKEYVFSPIQDWVYQDRFGQLHHIHGKGLDTAPSLQILEFTQKQENDLLDAAYPDAIIEQLHNNENADLKAMAKEQQYAFIAKQVTKAQNLYQIESTPDMILYCSLALAEGDAFDEREPYQTLLARKLNGDGNFGDLFTQQTLLVN